MVEGKRNRFINSDSSHSHPTITAGRGSSINLVGMFICTKFVCTKHYSQALKMKNEVLKGTYTLLIDMHIDFTF